MHPGASQSKLIDPLLQCNAPKLPKIGFIQIGHKHFGVVRHNRGRTHSMAADQRIHRPEFSREKKRNHSSTGTKPSAGMNILNGGMAENKEKKKTQSFSVWFRKTDADSILVRTAAVLCCCQPASFIQPTSQPLRCGTLNSVDRSVLCACCAQRCCCLLLRTN